MNDPRTGRPIFMDVSKMIESIVKETPFDFKKSLQAIEKKVIEFTLEKFRYNQAAAAEFLGMIEQTIRYRMRRYHIPTHRKSGFPTYRRRKKR